MPLRYTAQGHAGRDENQHSQPWYRQPETVSDAPRQVPAAVTDSSRFEPAEVERILAHAAALQDAHRQTLSREQLTEIAAEIGIQPEFVHRALEKEEGSVLSVDPRLQTASAAATAPRYLRRRIGAAILAYGAFAALIGNFAIASGQYELVSCFLFALPALLSVIMGILSGHRRIGAAAGGLLAASMIVAGTAADAMHSVTLSLTSQTLTIFFLMIASGAALGVLGAEARRQVSRRQLTSRSRRTGRRPA